MPPIYDFDNVPVNGESIYYLDTCTISLLMLNTAKQNLSDKSDVVKLMKQIIKCQGIIVTSTASSDELRKIIRRNILQSLQMKNESFEDVLQRNPAIVSTIDLALDSSFKQFVALPAFIQPYIHNQDLINKEHQLSSKTNLDNMDARGLIIAKSTGANFFISTDSDFKNINDKEMSICLPNRSIFKPTNVINIDIPTVELPQN